MSGTYVASDDVVTATVTNTLEPGSARLTFSYYTGKTQFATGALLARAGHTGIVGVWRGMMKIEYLDSSATSPGDTFRASEGSGGAASGLSGWVFNLLGAEALAQAGHIWQRE
jgi:hypothetical protein